MRKTPKRKMTSRIKTTQKIKTTPNLKMTSKMKMSPRNKTTLNIKRDLVPSYEHDKRLVLLLVKLSFTISSHTVVDFLQFGC